MLVYGAVEVKILMQEDKIVLRNTMEKSDNTIAPMVQISMRHKNLKGLSTVCRKAICKLTQKFCIMRRSKDIEWNFVNIRCHIVSPLWVLPTTPLLYVLPWFSCGSFPEGRSKGVPPFHTLLARIRN